MDDVDSFLLVKLAALDLKIKETCDLIPIQNWGFDASIQEKLRQRKHRIVAQHLSKDEKKALTHKRKQRLARQLGAMPTTVSETLKWMSGNIKVNNVNPMVAQRAEQQPAKTDGKGAKKVQAVVVKEGKKKLKLPPDVAKARAEREAREKKERKEQAKEESEEEEEGEESEGEQEGSDNEEEIEEGAESGGESSDNESEGDEDDDEEGESDEEEKEVEEEKKPKGKYAQAQPKAPVKAEKPQQQQPLKRKENGVDHVGPLAKKLKKEESAKAAAKEKERIDEELAELDKIDTKNLDPEQARQVAMQKLNKKLEALKVARRGNKSQEVYEYQRKMKRKMSKLKSKQKKTVQKKDFTHKNEGLKLKKEEAKTEEQQAEALKSEKAAAEGITYSKFDFIVKADKKAPTKKDQRDKFSGRNFKQLLEKAERRQEKIEDMREKDPEKAKKLEEDIKWNKVMNQAEGVKVKDNVEMLKKAVKRKEKVKQRGKAKWEDRAKEVDDKKEKKQFKRDTNLQKRIDGKKQKKIDGLKKRGRLL